jgi:hypothetical protein
MSSKPLEPRPPETDAKIWSLTLFVVAGIAAAVIFHYVRGAYLQRPYPENTFLFRPDDFARDFYNIYWPIQAGAPYGSRVSVYFPFAFLPLWFVRRIPDVVAFAAQTALLFGTSAAWIDRCIPEMPRLQRRVIVLTLGVISYPVIFCADRGNIETQVFVLLCVFLLCILRERWWLASLALAGAIAMKGYPGVFVVLLMSRRHYAEAALACGGALALSLASAALFPGGLHESLRLMAVNLGHFRDDYMIGSAGLAFNTSYFGLIKLVAFDSSAESLAKVAGFLRPYTVGCMFLFALLAANLVLRRQRYALWQEVALLTIAMLVLPEVSFDYKLIHLLLPLGLFLAAPPAASDDFHVLLFGLLLIPKAYFWLGGDISVAVIVNPLILTMLAISVLARPAVSARC